MMTNKEIYNFIAFAGFGAAAMPASAVEAARRLAEAEEAEA